MLKGYLENTGCTVSAPVISSATVHSTSAVSSTQAVSAVLSTHVASSVAISSSTSSIAPSIPISAASGQISTSTSSGASVSGSSSGGLSVNSGFPSSGLYRNATSATGFSAPASAVTSSTPTFISSGTVVSQVPASTEYTILTTYTTVTSCPVTTTRVQSGKTSIIVATSLITSTITTCLRCSEKTTSALVPVISSSTLGSPSEIGVTAAPPVPSSSASPSSSDVPQSSLSVTSTGQSSGLLPSPTTTEIVSTLTTTCSEATTFSLSSSGRVYTATAVCIPPLPLLKSLLTMVRMRLSPFQTAHAHSNTKLSAILPPLTLALQPGLCIQLTLQKTQMRTVSLL